MNKSFEQEKRWLLREKYGVENEGQLGGGKSFAFSADLKRLKSGEPLAFIIGWVEFLNCKIDLSFKPLIPRPETEFWVNDFIKTELREYTNILKNIGIEKRDKSGKNQKIKALDIFSGSGCIGISILKNTETLPQCCQVDFAEINPLFIKQIKKNLQISFGRSKASTKVHQSDVFDNIPTGKKYDYILANPPYIPKSKKINSSVLNFEDHSSLFANDNGLFFVKKTILEGFSHLLPQGKIFIEFDEVSKKEIENFLKEKKIQKYQFKKDQFQNWRLLIIEK